MTQGAHAVRSGHGIGPGELKSLLCRPIFTIHSQTLQQPLSQQDIHLFREPTAAQPVSETAGAACFRVAAVQEEKE